MLREIRRVENERLVLKIPKEYIHRKLEILVFPINEKTKPDAKKNNAREIEKNLKQFRVLMERTEKSNRRLPKEVNIDEMIDEMNNDIY